jgi:predicted acetyltransferase
MQWRLASDDDTLSLAEMNHQLISDEGHRNSMDVARLRERMTAWLATEYRAAIFEHDGEPVAYALFRRDEQERVHLRQFFVARPFRRRGVGRDAFHIFRTEVIPKDARVVLDVLVSNSIARAFWAAVGFREYAITLELEPQRQHHP